MEFIKDDCLVAMKNIPDKSIDCIICDLPYEITGIKWDIKIPFDLLWEQYNRIIKPNGNIVLFCSGIFTIQLINSNIKNYRYKLIWQKNVPTGMSSAKYRPMKYYEEIAIFGNPKSIYNPIMKPRVGIGKDCYNYNHYCGNNNHIQLNKVKKQYDPDWVQPSDILSFNVVPNRNGKLHPTQKPVELLEYLIKTYSNECGLILDNCAGSMSTAIAAINTNRDCICIENNDQYFDIGINRVKKHIQEKDKKIDIIVNY